jgi:hypothetical protein
MNFRSSSVAVATAMVALSFLGGCPGHIEDVTGTGGTSGGTCVPQGGTTTPPATFDTVRTAFLGGAEIEGCASAACHGLGGSEPPPPRKPIILQNDANLYANIMGYTSVACGNIPFVNPGKPDQSGLIKILTGPCGATVRMPFGCQDVQCFSSDTIAAISQWIANCAPEQ